MTFGPKIKTLGKTMFFLGLIFVALRVVPIGYRTLSASQEYYIPLKVSRYWVPRELKLVGIFDGTNPHFSRDPHFTSTHARVISYTDDGKTYEGRAQGYGINDGFKNPALQTDVLVIQLKEEDSDSIFTRTTEFYSKESFGYASEVYEYYHPDLCFECLSPSYRLTYLGQTNNQLVFLIDGDVPEDAIFTLMAVDFPKRQKSDAVIAQRGSADYDDLITGLQAHVGDGGNLALACTDRSKSVNTFVKTYFDVTC